MTNQLNTAVFYTCGVCNLQCKYCQIDKNPILKEIDKKLEESFNGDYYFNQVKKYFDNKTSLTRIETWGGEPFLTMDRIYPTLHSIINYYPYFNTMFSSTNFSYDSWIDQFFGLMDQFGQYPYRTFNYELQLSIDGPAHINDKNRGEKVTERCLNNFYKLLTKLKEGRLPKNVNLNMMVKATLDLNSIYQLNSKQAIIDYFLFFEDNMITQFLEADLPKNIQFYSAWPNTAVPSPETKEDGKIFANICKMCREIEEENRQSQIFKYYNSITFFSRDNNEEQVLTYKNNCSTCGSGITLIGFMPDNMLSTCHEGFTNFIGEYKKVAAKSDRGKTATVNFDAFINEQTLPFCLNEEGYAKHREKMSYFNNFDSSLTVASTVTEIIALALANQIDEKYLDPIEATHAALFLIRHTSRCFKDNYNKTGSFVTIPVGLMKLLLNGAREYIEYRTEEEIEKYEKKCKGDNCNGKCC